MIAIRAVVLVLPAAFAAACGTPAATEVTPNQEEHSVSNLYELNAPSLDGKAVDLSRWRGKVTLAVNVASECGFTPQYEGLEALHAELGPKGFEVLGFPSNEFGGQEPGSPGEIRSFCTSKYKVTFPLFAKVETKPGAGQSPVYAYLTTETGKTPRWNFCKYLVGKDGRAVAFFDSKVTPSDEKLRSAILTELAR